ncbi:MAG: hypothetical protein A4S08_10195 [Proteobacteria bacterium SG_bin4]|nr:MAG: hypothetical protein A4S08_10195 [Proteobacteria bacterium SG_bin4]
MAACGFNFEVQHLTLSSPAATSIQRKIRARGRALTHTQLMLAVGGQTILNAHIICASTWGTCGKNWSVIQPNLNFY